MMGRKGARVAALILLTGLVLVTIPAVGQAHGGGTPRLSDAEAGPYRVYAWTEPEPLRAGEVHITVAVTEPAAGDTGQAVPADDAKVVIRFTGESEGDLVEIEAGREGSLGGVYWEGEAELPTEGDWAVNVDVSGPAGSGVAQFRVEVLPSETLSWPLIVVGVGVLAAVLVVALWSRRRGRSQRSASAVYAQG